MTTSPARSDRAIDVVAVEPVGIVRASLEMVFGEPPDTTVVGTAADVDEALEVIRHLPSHQNVVVLAALELHGERDAFWLIRAVRDLSPGLVILATATDLTKASISQSLFSGADGFIHKNSTPERFVEAVRRAAAGELVLEGLPRGALGEIIEGIDEKRASVPALTDRETDVLSAAAKGLTARQIGRHLGVSERTVTTHLHNIYRKLDAGGRVAAVSCAVRLGLLPPLRDPALAKISPFAIAR